MSSFGGTIHRDELLWLLGSLSGLYRLPFDAALMAQSFPPLYGHSVLHEATRSQGFKTGIRATAGLDWQKLPLPAVGFLLPATEISPPPVPDSPTADQAATDETAPSPHTLLIILKIEGEQLLYFRIGSQAPETITTAEAGERLGSELILVGKETATGDDAVIPGFPVEKKPFDFSWFIPELLKHKKKLAGHPVRLPCHSATVKFQTFPLYDNRFKGKEPVRIKGETIQITDRWLCRDLLGLALCRHCRGRSLEAGR